MHSLLLDTESAGRGLLQVRTKEKLNVKSRAKTTCISFVLSYEKELVKEIRYCSRGKRALQPMAAETAL